MGIPRAMQIAESEVIQQLGTNLPGSRGRRERRALILRDGVKAQLPLPRSMGLPMLFCPLAFPVIFKAAPFVCREGIFKILFTYFILRERESELDGGQGGVGAEGEGQVDSELSAEPDVGLNLPIPEITT